MMLENMNLSVDPCEDFYEFSCGGYIQKTRLDDQQSATNTFNQLDRNLNFLLSGISIFDIIKLLFLITLKDYI